MQPELLSASLRMHYLKNSPRSNFLHVSLERQIVWHAKIVGVFALALRVTRTAQGQVEFALAVCRRRRRSRDALFALRARCGLGGVRKYEKCFHFLLIATRAIVWLAILIWESILLTPARSSSRLAVFSFRLFKCLGECNVFCNSITEFRTEKVNLKLIQTNNQNGSLGVL
jgi:hypothetical protein